MMHIKQFQIVLLSLFCLSCNGQKIDWDLKVSLPSAVKESSGIAVVNNLLYTHNDSGDGPNIYAIDLASGELKYKVKLSKADNTDWEDMDYFDGHLYIADTGNNNGKRKKMTLYKVPVEGLLEGGKIPKTGYEKFKFRFEDKHGIPTTLNCEAMTVDNDMVYFISKSKSGKSGLYGFRPKVDGEENATFLTSINFPFQVTAAYMYEGKMYVTGYNKLSDNAYYSSLGLIEKGADGNWENATFVPIKLSFSGQCESIFIKDGSFYLTTERNLLNPSTLYIIKIQKVTQ